MLFFLLTNVKVPTIIWHYNIFELEKNPAQLHNSFITSGSKAVCTTVFFSIYDSLERSDILLSSRKIKVKIKIFIIGKYKYFILCC